MTVVMWFSVWDVGVMGAVARTVMWRGSHTHSLGEMWQGKQRSGQTFFQTACWCDCYVGKEDEDNTDLGDGNGRDEGLHADSH